MAVVKNFDKKNNPGFASQDDEQFFNHQAQPYEDNDSDDDDDVMVFDNDEDDTLTGLEDDIPPVDDEEIDDEEEPEEDIEEEDLDDEPEEDSELADRIARADKTIIKLKNDLKRQREENNRLRQQGEKAAVEYRKEEAIQEYLQQGFDEKAAAKMAERDEVAFNAQKRLELLDFRMDNEDVLRKYRVTKDDLPKVMRAVNEFGKSVDQVCKAFYGKAESNPEVRARKAARGELKDDDDNTVSRASRSSKANKKTALSPADRKNKRELENRFLDGEKISDEKYLQYKKQYNL